jgi:hypothetical protein
MALSHSPQIVKDGLVLYLDAANIKSYPGTGTTWFGLRNNNNGTLENGVGYSTNNLGSLVFDGINDRIVCGTFSVSFLTVSVWVYKTSTTTNQGICRKNFGWAISQLNGTLQVAIGTSWTFYNTGYTIPLNTWVNIVYTYSGTGSSSQTVYINGSSIFTNSNGSGALVANTNPVRIGFDDNNWFWGGRIAQTQIYNRILSAQEIKQNFEAIRRRYDV